MKNYNDIMKLLQGRQINNKIYIKTNKSKELVKIIMEFLEKNTNVGWVDGSNPTSFTHRVEYIIIVPVEIQSTYYNVLGHNNLIDVDTKAYHPYEIMSQVWAYREVD